MAKKDKGQRTGDPVSYQIPDPAGGVRMETFIPWTLVKRGVKREVITPLDAVQQFVDEAIQEKQMWLAEQDRPLMRALGLAHHWQQLLDKQKFASADEIAHAEGIDVTQVRRLLRLTLLAPQVIERLIVTPGMVLEQVMRRPWPDVWDDQLEVIATS